MGRFDPVLFLLCDVPHRNGGGWKFLWLIVPFVNIFFAIKINFDLAKSFGKGVGYGFGLLLLPIVFYPLLGLGSDLYIGPQTG